MVTIIIWATLSLLLLVTLVQVRSVRRFFWMQGEKLVRARPLRQHQQSTLEFALVQLDANNWRRTIIYLPKDYDRSGRTRYPVVVFLHGVPGRETDWLNPSLGDAQKTIDQAISQKKIRPFIAVFPAGGNTFTDDTQYINSADGKNNNEDFIYQNVVK